MTNPKPSAPSGARKLIKLNPVELERYTRSHGTFVPLYRYDAIHTKTMSDGTVRIIKDGKRPLHIDWNKRPYDSAKVLKWCVEKNHNVGLRLPAEIVVIDIDPRNGGDEGWDNLTLELGLDEAIFPCVITGSGGRHYYAKKPADVPLLDTLKDFPGVEFKSKGRQVVAAGSIHPDTLNYYVWDNNAPALDALPEIPDSFLRLITRPQRTAVTSGGQLDQEQAATVLARLNPEDFGTNEKWLKLMMAIHHATLGDARQEWIDWSIGDPKYAHDAEHIGRRWDSLHTDKGGEAVVTIGTLRHFLSEAGELDVLPPDQDAAHEDFEGEEVDLEAASGNKQVTSIERRGIKVNPKNSKAEDTYTNAFIAVLQSGVDPAWNEMSQTVVFRNAPWDASHGFTLDDHTLRIVRLYLSNVFQGNAYEPGEKHVFDAIMAVAYQNKFNPVLDYLDGLTWDGVPRLDRFFVDYFRCGDTPYTRSVSACFGIGAVRRVRQPGCKLDTMPVVKGPQGFGKSTGVQAYFGRQWFTDTDMGSLRDKDAAMKLRGVWCVEFAEIDSLNKVETGILKAFMSRGTDRQRDPYGRIVEDHPRRCVFLATVNEGGYLKDSTGARRFWPLELTDRVDVAGIAADRDQLWAEAVAREAAGESHVLPQALWSVAAEEQTRQTTDDPWADVLSAFLGGRERDWYAGEFEPEEDPRPPDRIFTWELFDALGINAERRTKGLSQRLRTVMESALGWKHHRNVHWRGEQGKGYTRTHAH
ncbi:VapE domain-containing protein [Bradyrhizobium sp. AUGA SZCCT0182]|uniref:VapE domain-containing protein n=1 Tax=Bradyrhizobium sp. AUGA SZCCT0182 TaxID=2807667 RepID=UPI001BA698C2|nr:VapE domain-containing protein [Bradyrhizobium sp. AUGA SZCCT0182]MBR1234117.1 bifunctional DNA primase/polymerase [Bradyrhizobium sp. AUGA SZCCT0182]